MSDDYTPITDADAWNAADELKRRADKKLNKNSRLRAELERSQAVIEAAKWAVLWSRENSIPGNPESIRRLDKAISAYEAIKPAEVSAEEAQG